MPTNLTGVKAIAAGWNHNVALLSNGTVTAWGIDGSNVGWYLTEVPSGLSNVTAIAANSLHSRALKNDGTVVGWGYGPDGEASVPAGLSNVVAIAAGEQHNLALKVDGTILAWGYNGSGQTNVPSGLSNVLDVAAGPYHCLALLSNGTVVAWGDGSHGETNVPASLSNIVAIAAGGDPFSHTAYSLALKKDGTVVKWGDSEAMTSVQGLSNVVAIAAGADHALAIRTGPRTPVITLEPSEQDQVTGGSATFTARGAGLYGVAYQWYAGSVSIAGATNATLTLTNVQVAQETNYHVVISNEVASITSSNANFYLVTSPTVIAQSPASTNPVVYYQSNMVLNVSASGHGQNNGFPLGYQWQFNGTNIGGANTASYSFYAVSNTAGTYSVIVTNAGGNTNASWSVSINYNTLAYHLSTNAVAYASGYSGTPTDMLEFTAPNSTNLDRLTNAAWSTNFWLHGVRGLSATPIGFSNALGGAGLPTMVSPRHYLFATHMHPETNTLAFLDTNNVIYFRTTLQRADVTNDTSVGILNADLPSSVEYMPVVPANILQYLPTNGTFIVQGIGMNQEFRLFSQPMVFGNPVSPLSVNWSNTLIIPYGLGTNWSVVIVNNDSSAPEVLPIDNQLVLISHNFSVNIGPNYAFQIDAINAIMHYLSTNNGLGTDYQLTIFSLTNRPIINP